MRTITASEDAMPVIDKGADVDTKLKALAVEDKGLKDKLIEFLKGEITKEETSVRAEGNTAAAIITATEKVTIKIGAEQFVGLRKAVMDGLLPFVSHNQSLTVPPAKVEEAAKILKDAGIVATVSETFAAKAVDVRKMRDSEVASAEEGVARKALESCLSTDKSYRVKYAEIKDGENSQG